MEFFIFGQTFSTNTDPIIILSILGSISLLLLFIGVALLCFYILLKIKRFRRILNTTYTYLEVKPTDRTLKTSLTNTKLFEILHSLEKPYIWWDKFLGYKKPVSYELVSSKYDGIRFILRLAKTDAPSVKKTLLAYLPGIEVKETSDYLTDTLVDPCRMEELTLKSSFIYPLAEQPQLQQYDPLSFLTGYLTKLKDNEQIALQFICTPLHESTHGKVLDTIHTLQAKILNNESADQILSQTYGSDILSLLSRVFAFVILTPVTLLAWIFTNSKQAFPSWLFDTPEVKQIKTSGQAKNELLQTIASKLNQPLFEVQIKVFIQTTTNPQERLQGIIASFESFATAHQTIKRKKNLFRYIQTPLLQKLQYFLLKNRLSLGSNNTILSTTELAGLYHLPHVLNTKTEDLLQVKSPKLPAPLSLKKNKADFDIAFAHNTYGETDTTIGVTLEERRRHTYIIGATGTGKTTLLTHMIYQDMVKGNGLAVIDPHGDLAEKLLGVIPKERIKDVVYFNPYDIEFPIGLNVLEIPEGLSEVELQREKDFITSTLISIFHKLYDPRYSGPRMEHILRNVILTALEQDKPTLFTIYDLLTNMTYRKKVTGELKDEVLKAFWKNEFEKLGSFQKAEQISPITNKLGRFLTTSMTRNILNQSESKLDFEKIMNHKKILICNLSKGKIGEDTSKLLGTTIIAKIQQASMRRARISASSRTPFYLFVDEFQNFATSSFTKLLSGGRKFGLRITIAEQSTAQQDDRNVVNVILANTGTVVCFRTASPIDEELMLSQFLPYVKSGDIGNLPRFKFYIKLSAVEPEEPFSGETLPPNIEYDPEQVQRIIEASRKNYAIEYKKENTKSTKVKDKAVEKKKKKAVKDNDLDTLTV
ncbi:MAG: type IV secretion system DNA-binding domain-containing protein [bacterium]|nr:type IV secretion system DNA-binding domain-containing protein [bacterium]